MRLTSQQKLAVGHDGNLLLQACPGSGKTRTIIAKLVSEIERVRDTPFSVACITYTNAAVEEIDSRVSSEIMSGDERNYVVSTIHSFCLHHLLRPFAWRVPGFNGSMKVLTRDREEFEEIVRYATSTINYNNPNSGDLEAFTHLNRDIDGSPAGSALNNNIVRNAAEAYWDRAEQLGFIDFSNIIYKSFCLLRDNQDIRSSIATRFRSFLIDEFQDTTDVQIAILRSIHSVGKSRFFLVGDPYQSIFGFAGARPELVAPFARDIGARVDISLSANFRSNPAVVGQGELLFPRTPAMSSEGRNRADRNLPQFFWGNTLSAITDNFLPELSRQQIPLGRAAILARNWPLLVPIAKHLREFGIPIVGPGARPYRRGRLFSSLAEQLCAAVLEGYSYPIRQLERSIFHAIQDVSGEPRLDVFTIDGRRTAVHLIRRAQEFAQHGGAIFWLDNMAVETGKILLEGNWIEYSQAGLFSASVNDMKADMVERNIDIGNLSIEDLGIFANPSRALRLMTIHNSKGREFEAVALIGLRDGTLPDWRANTDEAIAAERRLFYVGVTRAEKILMYVGEPNNFGNPPSRFLGIEGVNIQ